MELLPFGRPLEQSEGERREPLVAAVVSSGCVSSIPSPVQLDSEFQSLVER